MNKNNAALLSIVSNMILIIFKLVAGLLVGSISVISEAIHSTIDLLASFIAFLSIRKSSEAEDEEHPFGHGKYENVSGFVEAILILLAALIIIYEAVGKLIHGVNLESVGIGIFVMLTASLINLTISLTLFKISKRTDSIALEADAMHLLTDVFTSAGVFVGLAIIKFTGLKILDPITAILVALLIIKASVDLIRKSLKDLVDSKLPDIEIEKITEVLKAYPEILGYHKLRTRKSGQNREIDIHIEIEKDASLVQAHNICSNIEVEIGRILPNSSVTIHAEPLEDKLQILKQ